MIMSILGIGESPFCDTLGEKGVSMEELMSQLGKKSIKLKCFDIPVSYLEGEDQETEAALNSFLGQVASS